MFQQPLLLIGANEIDDNSLRFSVFSSGPLPFGEERKANIYTQLKLRLAPLAVMWVLFTGAFAPAQITSVTSDQAPPIPGVGHDYIGLINETVSPSNGALSIRINLPTPAGRGISLPFSIGYDSNAAHHFWATRSQGVADNSSYLGRGGWSYGLPQLSMQENDDYWFTQSPVQKYDCYYFTDYMLTALNGESHELPISASQPITGYNCSGMGNPPVNGIVPNEWLSGREDKFQAVTTAVPTSSTTPPAVTTVDQDGTVYYFSNLKAHPVPSGYPSSNYSSLPDWIEDRNGNKLTFIDNGSGTFSITDTLDRTVLSSSGFGTTGNTITLPGASNQYQLTWGSHGSNWPFNSQLTDLATPTQTENCSAYTTGANTYVVTLPVITNILLPNGNSYQFQYDSTSGLANKIIYPTGAYVRYLWGTNPMSNEILGLDTKYYPNCQWMHDSQVITDRYVSFDGVTEVLHQTFSYATTYSQPSWCTPCTIIASHTTTVTTYDLVRNTNYKTIYSYGMVALATPRNEKWLYDNLSVPVENSITYSDTNGALLQTVTKGWFDQYELGCEVDTLANGMVSGKFYTYGPGAVVTDVKEYDYGQLSSSSVCYNGATAPTSPAPMRETVTSYQSFGDTPIWQSGASIFDRPVSIQVYQNGSGGTLMAETDYSYDQTSTSPVSAIQHDDAEYPAGSGVVRGNATTKTVKCLQTGCANAITTYTYDQTGRIPSVMDACGNGTCSDMTGSSHTTNYSYADNYTVLSNGSNVAYTPSGNTNAFVTQITDPLGHIQKFTYDYASDELTAGQDQNDINAGRPGTTYIYSDVFFRPTQVNYPDGGQIQHVYNDSAPSPTVTTCQLISGTAGAACSATTLPPGWKTSLATMDGMRHVVQAELASDPDGPTYTATAYDGNGKVYTGSNPYRTTSDPTYGVTTYTYDALGRTTNVAEPDGSAVTTSYSGNCTTVTDEASNARQSCADGLRRMTKVLEDPGSPPHLNYETDYSYDALNNLLSVTQNGSRARTFTYDSLSRLLCAANPEVQIVTCPALGGTFPTGAITYTYDPNGNLSTKVVPKANQTGTLQTTHNYTYDVLNRLVKESHLDPNQGTELYSYDGITLTGCSGPAPPKINSPTNLIGRRTAMCAGLSSSTLSYDAMGRSLFEATANKGSSAKTYIVGYTYYLDGSLKTLTYPSGDVVTYTVGGAGRTTQVTDSASNTFVAPPTNPPTMYAPHGALVGMTSGTGIVTSNAYNNRLQPFMLSAGVPGQSAIFSLCYDFHLHVALSNLTCGSLPAYTTGDNGNVFQVLNQVDPTRSTAFTYDPLNRIAQANTVNTTSTNCWGETYTIDAWGNLTGIAAAPGMAGNCVKESLSATATTQNQLSGVGMQYDAAGNVTKDNLGNMPTYDAENRIATVGGYTYSYDADGARMEKAAGSTGTMYWMGPSGALAETDLTGAINEEYIFLNGARIARVDRPSGSVYYYFSDQLASTSVIASPTGLVKEQYFYYPYGGMQSSTGSDPNHYKFTGKERDSESGLDMFGARYYGSSLGRFMTPDNPKFSEKANPQTWNLYSYVGNNPLNRVDPTGHNWFCVGASKTTACHWAWHQGNTFEGQKSNFTHLLVLQKTGQKTADGATIVKLTLYGNDEGKAIAQGTGYSGGSASNFKTTPNGSYEINLNLRGGPETNRGVPTGVANGAELGSFAGLQEIGKNTWVGDMGYDFQRAWGTQRANLNTPDGDPTAYYLHGKQDPWFYTHGCTCEKDQKVLGVIFGLDPSGVGEGDKNGKIAVSVSRSQ